MAHLFQDQLTAALSEVAGEQRLTQACAEGVSELVVCQWFFAVDFLQIHAAQVACLIWKQGLFATGIRSAYSPQGRRGIAFFNTVEEYYAGLSVLPRVVDDEVEDIAGPPGSNCRLGSGVDELVIRISFHCGHEGVGNSHRNIEV